MANRCALNKRGRNETVDQTKSSPEKRRRSANVGDDFELTESGKQWAMQVASYLSPPTRRNLNTMRDGDREQENSNRRDQSDDKLIALLERNCESERKEKELLQAEVSKLRMSQNASASNRREQAPTGSMPYYMGGLNTQYHNSSAIHQAVNTFAAPSNVNNRDEREDNRNVHRHRPYAPQPLAPSPNNPPPKNDVTDAGSGNSWFQADPCYTGGTAPSGRNTPEYWDGNWEGTPTVPKPVEHQRTVRKTTAPSPGNWSGPIVRSAAAKHARNQKKKEKQELIGLQAHGEIGDIPVVSSDNAEKKQVRAGAWKLLAILAEKRVENGRTPESAFSDEAAVCAKLGPTFLTLAQDGEHYAAK